MSDVSKPSKEELRQAALAWAEFLYDEYMLKKRKQLLLDCQDKTIERTKQGGKSKS